MEIREIWAISPERIEAFFLSQDGGSRRGEGLFAFGDCRVRVAVLPERQMGRFRFPQTQVDFEGPEEETEALHRRFILQFISAGG